MLEIIYIASSRLGSFVKILPPLFTRKKQVLYNL
jgi:hypothetical protein